MHVQIWLQEQHLLSDLVQCHATLHIIAGILEKDRQGGVGGVGSSGLEG